MASAFYKQAVADKSRFVPENKDISKKFLKKISKKWLIPLKKCLNSLIHYDIITFVRVRTKALNM